ncbi:hypothetical protein GCM10010095_75010 [Streptomyces anthocyanicus]|nr:hypothetical protein GCM10010095_75010 [Streptomyces anthocyanicus]
MTAPWCGRCTGSPMGTGSRPGPGGLVPDATKGGQEPLGCADGAAFMEHAFMSSGGLVTRARLAGGVAPECACARCLPFSRVTSAPAYPTVLLPLPACGGVGRNQGMWHDRRGGGRGYRMRSLSPCFWWGGSSAG